MKLVWPCTNNQFLYLYGVHKIYIIYLYAIISNTTDRMIWLIYGIMCIPYLRVYAMFWHRNHVSLDYVSYNSLIHRKWCNSIDINEEHCILMLTVPFSLLNLIIFVVISSILYANANQRTPYSLHLSSAYSDA